MDGMERDLSSAGRKDTNVVIQNDCVISGTVQKVVLYGKSYGSEQVP